MKKLKLFLLLIGFGLPAFAQTTLPDSSKLINNQFYRSPAGGIYLYKGSTYNPTAYFPLAPLISPAFTGVPTAPTAAPGTNTNQIATMAAILAASPSISATTPIQYSAGTISILTASGSQAGALSSTDWNTFNNKLSPTGSGASLTDVVHTTGNETLAGNKTFTGILSHFQTPAFGTSIGFYNQATFTTGTLSSGATTTRAWSLPNASGTIALTSDLSLYAPLASPTFTGTVSAGTISVNNILANNPALDDIGTLAGNRFRTIYSQGLNLTDGVLIRKTTPAGFSSSLAFQNASGVNRWLTGVLTAETGSGNTGTDFGIYAYNDDGSLSGSTYAMKITRSTRAVDFNGSVSVAALTSAGGISGTTLSVTTGTFSGTTVLIGSGGGSGQLTLAQSGVRNWGITAGGVTSGNFSITNGTDGLEKFGINGTSGAATFSNDINMTTGEINHTGRLVIDAGAGSGYLIRTNNLATTAIDIASSGASVFGSTVTATGFFESSDLNLKDVIYRVPSASGFDMIAFKWKPELKRDSNIHYGYGAQEVKPIMPDQVLLEHTGALSVNYTDILVKKSSDQEARISELEKNVLKLKRRRK